uniref:Uncharacterized protein n=1 Tax=viral metagenome TaxID=1070528 RepID=A0A6H1ZVC8_9ZZZZ
MIVTGEGEGPKRYCKQCGKQAIFYLTCAENFLTIICLNPNCELFRKNVFVKISKAEEEEEE